MEVEIKYKNPSTAASRDGSRISCHPLVVVVAVVVILLVLALIVFYPPFASAQSRSENVRTHNAIRGTIRRVG